jgi:hypothetical protein
LLDPPIVRVVKARIYIGPAPAGSSQSFFVKADDGETYLLKNQTNPQGINTLVNEVIGSSIARLTGAPTAESVLIEVEPDFLAVSNLPGVPLGLHFGSKCVADIVGPAKAMIPLVDNTHQFVHVVTSDVVTNNSDRNNPGNFLIRVIAENPRRLEFIAIDFGHCFGHAWDESIVNQSGWCGNMLPEMNPFIAGTQPFAGPVDACKKIPKGTVDAIVDAIPASWNLSAPKSTAIRQYLLNRLQTVDQLLEAHRGSFPNWK